MAVDPDVGGGVDRDKLPEGDFAGPHRSFPIVTPGDVSDAASSLGRAKGDHDSIKARIIAIAHRKGPEYVAQLPDAWQVKKAADAPAEAPVTEEPPQRYILAIAYQAGPDPRIVTGADGARDYFSPEELEHAAWAFMNGPREVGLYHEDGTVGHAVVVESYIHRGPAFDMGGTTVTTGAWLMGLILDELAWELYLTGHITGLSPQGTAKRRSTQ